MSRTHNDAVAAIAGGLIVSCQPRAPLNRPDYVADLATVLVDEGARGLRIEGLERIAAVRAAVRVPILGIIKRHLDGVDCYITPTADDVIGAIDAGADIVALDGRDVPRPDGSTVSDLIGLAHDRGAAIMADVSTAGEGTFAARQGADLVASTLSGYTAASPSGPEPDLRLVEALARLGTAPTVAEGRLNRPEDVAAAFSLGAHAVVVGRAITEPRFLVGRFLGAVPDSQDPSVSTPSRSSEGTPP